MDKKVIDFKEVLKNQEQQEECLCPNCQIKYSMIDDFIEMFENRIMNPTNGSDGSFAENTFSLIEQFYDEIYIEGRRNAYEDMMSFSAYKIDQIDSDTVED